MEASQVGRVAQVIRSRRHALGAALGGAAVLGLPGMTPAKKKSKKKCKPKSGHCTCKSGNLCFGNGSCGKVCNQFSPPCPDGCSCTNGSDFQGVCLGLDATCENTTDSCAGSSSCPEGTVCKTIAPCGGRCVPVCAA
jgi:hypothetical protein